MSVTGVAILACPVSEKFWPLTPKSILMRRSTGFWPCIEFATLKSCVTLPEPLGGTVVPLAGLICSFMYLGTATCAREEQGRCVSVSGQSATCTERRESCEQRRRPEIGQGEQGETVKGCRHAQVRPARDRFKATCKLLCERREERACVCSGLAATAWTV
eukprot:6198545-Pleurochrysis_carterae.AAC.1